MVHNGYDQRNKLNFVEEVISTFHFLTVNNGFLLVRTEPPFLVRYESKKIYIDFLHDRISYEIEFRLGDTKNPLGESFSINEVIRLNDAWTGKDLVWFQASSKESVKKCLLDLSHLIQENIDWTWFENPEVFEKLACIREILALENQKAYELRSVRQEAENAWQNKNYAKVVELYSRIRNNLAPSELKKLEYARKKSV